MSLIQIPLSRNLNRQSRCVKQKQKKEGNIMPTLKTRMLFISHAWNYSEKYYKLNNPELFKKKLELNTGILYYSIKRSSETERKREH